jgi:hypothetical protein
MNDERGREKGASARRGKVWEMTGSLHHGLAGAEWRAQALALNRLTWLTGRSLIGFCNTEYPETFYLWFLLLKC